MQKFSDAIEIALNHSDIAFIDEDIAELKRLLLTAIETEIRLVLAMRKAQSRYFASRTVADLQRAIGLESQVDALLSEFTPGLEHIEQFAIF